jgi:hypothetical protein
MLRVDEGSSSASDFVHLPSWRVKRFRFAGTDYSAVQSVRPDGINAHGSALRRAFNPETGPANYRNACFESSYPEIIFHVPQVM